LNNEEQNLRLISNEIPNPQPQPILPAGSWCRNEKGSPDQFQRTMRHFDVVIIALESQHL